MRKRDKFVVWMFVAGLALLGLAGLLYGLWSLIASLDESLLATWALVSILALPVVFAWGFWFGKTEVRGFLKGVDTSLDRLARVMIAVGGKQSRSGPQPIDVSGTKPEPYTLPVNYPLPELDYRAPGEEVIDL